MNYSLASGRLEIQGISPVFPQGRQIFAILEQMDDVAINICFGTS